MKTYIAILLVFILTFCSCNIIEVPMSKNEIMTALQEIKEGFRDDNTDFTRVAILSNNNILAQICKKNDGYCSDRERFGNRILHLYKRISYQARKGGVPLIKGDTAFWLGVFEDFINFSALEGSRG